MKNTGKKIGLILIIAIAAVAVFAVYNNYSKNKGLYSCDVINSRFLLNPPAIMWNMEEARNDGKCIRELIDTRKKKADVGETIDENLKEGEKFLIRAMHKKYMGSTLTEVIDHCNIYIDLSDVINTEILKDAKIDIDMDITEKDMEDIKKGKGNEYKNIVININTEREDEAWEDTNKKYILKVRTNGFPGTPSKILLNGKDIGKDCIIESSF